MRRRIARKTVREAAKSEPRKGLAFVLAQGETLGFKVDDAPRFPPNSPNTPTRCFIWYSSNSTNKNNKMHSKVAVTDLDRSRGQRYVAQFPYLCLTVI